MAITKITVGQGSSYYNPPTTMTAQNYIDSYNELFAKRDKAYAAIPSFNQYKDEKNMRQQEVERILAEFNKSAQTLLDNLDKQIEANENKIQSKKYPSMAGNKQLLATENNTAILLLNGLTGHFPIAQAQRYYSQGRIDLVSALIDETNDMDVVPSEVMADTVNYREEEQEWKSTVNSINTALGINQLKIENLQLERAAEILNTNLTAVNAGADTKNTTLLLSAWHAKYEADKEYNEAIAELQI